MYLTRFTYVITFFFLLNGVKAQTAIGLSGGLVNNMLKESDPGNYRISSSNGFVFAVSVETSLNKRLSLVFQPGFIQKNYKKIAFSSSQIYELYQNTYLSVPVVVRISLLSNQKFKLFIDAGGFWGYWLKGRESGQLPDILSSGYPKDGESGDNFRMVRFSADKTFNTMQDKRFDAGGTLGAGVTRRLKRNLISLELHGLRSLTSVRKSDDHNLSWPYNRSFSLQLTYAYEL